ncbi:MAG TPA: hypothetical protein VFU46_00195 [Gemmatimonadales bacterium]|nr:hypothetical protein [Gemmatimonadales bacterium]
MTVRLLALVAPLAAGAGAGLPAWLLSVEAKATLRELWETSAAAHRERVACLGGAVGDDTVRITRARILDGVQSDSLNASAGASIERCAPPEWVGTVHTHVRSTDDDVPAPRFSPGDRAVMSEWSRRHGRAGAFCVLYSARGAHCEVYPPREEPRMLRPGRR